MRKFLLALSAVAAFTGSASAADLGARPYTKAPPPVPVYSWTGCYIGGGGGYGLFNAKHDEFVTGAPQQATNFPIGTQTSLTETAGGEGWLGIVGGGCDYQFSPGFLGGSFLGGNFVVGAFADYTWSDIHGDTNTFAHFFGDNSAVIGVGNLKQRDSWAVGGRVGYVIPSIPQLLTYVSGGYSEARFDSVNFVNELSPNIGFNQNLALPSHTYHGWFVGGGTEYALGWLPGLFLKSEYRYYTYDSATLPTVCGGPSAVGGNPACFTAGPTGFSDHYTPHVQTIFTELVYRFNWGGPLVGRY